MLAALGENDKKGMSRIYGMLVDQAPKPGKTYHWSNFLGLKFQLLQVRKC